MSSARIYQLLDLIEDIKKVEQLIVLHQNQSGSNQLMLEQYQAKKVKLTSQLIIELTSTEFKSTNSLIFIKHFLEKYFGEKVDSLQNEKRIADFDKLEAAIRV